jgi:hypothetical protein
MVPLSEDEELDKSAARHAERRGQYSATAAERLQLATDTQYSLLPYQELERTAGLWFDAAYESLMRANYGPLDAFIRDQVEVGASQGFELDDLILMLRLLRRTAIEGEGWNEDMLLEMDDVTNEAVGRLRGQVVWDIPEGINYLTGETAADRQRQRAAEEAAQASAEKRTYGRNKLHLPVRIHGFLPKGAVDEVTRTENVARGGVYFLSENPYYPGVRLHVSYPYWDAPGAINPVYEAEVVRVDEMGSETHKGVAIRFRETLGPPKKKRRP